MEARLYCYSRNKQKVLQKLKLENIYHHTKKLDSCVTGTNHEQSTNLQRIVQKVK